MMKRSMLFAHKGERADQSQNKAGKGGTCFNPKELLGAARIVIGKSMAYKIFKLSLAFLYDVL